MLLKIGRIQWTLNR